MVFSVVGVGRTEGFGQRSARFEGRFGRDEHEGVVKTNRGGGRGVAVVKTAAGWRPGYETTRQAETAGSLPVVGRVLMLPPAEIPEMR